MLVSATQRSARAAVNCSRSVTGRVLHLSSLARRPARPHGRPRLGGTVLPAQGLSGEGVAAGAERVGICWTLTRCVIRRRCRDQPLTSRMLVRETGGCWRQCGRAGTSPLGGASGRGPVKVRVSAAGFLPQSGGGTASLAAADVYPLAAGQMLSRDFALTKDDSAPRRGFALRRKPRRRTCGRAAGCGARQRRPPSGKAASRCWPPFTECAVASPVEVLR